MRSPWALNPVTSGPTGGGRLKRRHTGTGEAGRAGGGDGSGAAGATGAHRGLEPFFPRRPRRREPHGMLGFWAVAKRRPRDCCALPASGPSATPTVPPAKPHQHPGAAAAASRRVHRGCRNHVSFVASPPHPAPQKKGNWNRAGTQYADKWNCVLTGKGALSSGHFPHLILPPAAGLRLTPDLEVTPGSGFGAASCSSAVGSVYS